MSGHPQGGHYDDGYGQSQQPQGQPLAQDGYYHDDQQYGQYHDDANGGQGQGHYQQQQGDAYYDEQYVCTIPAFCLSIANFATQGLL
jgi:1,3-beta-glucan synthase